MSSLSKKILDKIENKKVKPRPKWYFRCMYCSKWLLAITLIVIGSLLWTVFMFAFRNTANEISAVLHEEYLGALASALPYIWLLILLLILAASYGHIRHILDGGYKLHSRYIVLIIIVASVSFGTFWYNLGFGMVLDGFMQRNMPGYRGVITTQERMWVEPENNRIGGRIMTRAETHIVLEDFSGKTWHVRTDDMDEYQKTLTELYGTIALVGVPLDEVTFHSCYVYPWMVHGSTKDYTYLSSHLSPQKRHKLEEKLKYEKLRLSIERNVVKERSNKCKGIELLGTSN